MDIKSYLKRIGIDEINTPSLGFLRELQNRHLLSIPFEDLDIPHKGIELNIEKIYNKIIPTNRGGFCYELNGLFHWFLTALGFSVNMLSARVFNSRKQDFGFEFDHLTLLVHLDKDYLVDVGFGDSFRSPMEMPSGETKDVSGSYQIKQIGNDNFELQKEIENNWKPQYCFTTIPRKLIDFKEMCNFQQDSTASSFRTGNLCTIATSSGRITLTDSSLTIKEGVLKNKISFGTKEEFNSYLKKYFSIEIQF